MLDAAVDADSSHIRYKHLFQAHLVRQHCHTCFKMTTCTYEGSHLLQIDDSDQALTGRAISIKVLA